MVLFDPDFSSLSSEELAELDKVCGEFERKRIAGDRCSIEQCMVGASPKVRDHLLQELIRIDIEIGIDWDTPIDCDTYVASFPDHSDFIKKLWNEVSFRTRSGEEKDHSWALDSPPALSSFGSTFRLQGSQSGTRANDSTSNNDSSSNRSTSAGNKSRFQIVRNLASGGIGTVYVGMDNDLSREVAIKVLKRKFAQEPGVLSRFRMEATITSQLEHPNIVPVYAVGVRNDGLPFYAMRLVKGRSLQQSIHQFHAAARKSEPSSFDFRRHPVGRDLLMRFIVACRATAFAHSKGVVHRDIKPSNIMMDDFGETLLVDWGLAMHFHPNTSTKPSADHAPRVVGTPGYMSPEQAAGKSDSVDQRADIYSLGATLVTLLTDLVPASLLDTGIHSQVAIHNGKRTYPSLDSLWANSHRLPPALKSIAMKAMKDEPSDRYQSAEELADDLTYWLADEPVSVVRDSIATKARRWMKDHPAPTGAILAGGACITFALVLGTILLASQNEVLRQANQREQSALKAAVENASIAQTNAVEADKQRKRMLSVLDRFLIDVERGLRSVPGGAKVQRNVLVTVLNELDVISQDFGYKGDADLSNAIALLDLAGLFSRVGNSDVLLNQKSAELLKGEESTPLAVAERLSNEAWKIVSTMKSDDPSGYLESVKAQTLESQAEIMKQTGRLEEALERLKESLRYRLEHLQKDPESVGASVARIRTLDLVGQIYLTKKQPEAETIFVESYELIRALSEKIPNNPIVLRTLAISCNRRGDIANNNGDLDAAERWYEQDMSLTQKIYDEDPQNGAAKRDFCVSLDRLGRCREKRGQLETAIQAYEESRQLRTELVEAEPTDMQSIRELFVSNFKLGMNNMLIQKSEDAKRYYRQADELAKQLAEMDKSNVLAKRYQSMCAEAMCDIQLSEQNYDEALRFAHLSCDIIQSLAKQSPDDKLVREDLYVIRTKIAKVHKLRGDFDASLQELDLAKTIVEESMTSTGQSLESLADYSYILVRLGDASIEANRPERTIEYVKQMLQNESRIPSEKRQDVDARRLIVNAHILLGRAYLKTDDREKGVASLETARTLAQSMIDQQMRVERMQEDIRTIDEILATIAQ